MEYPQINKTPAQLFERADDAKFQAKRSGLTKFIALDCSSELDKISHRGVAATQLSGTKARGHFKKRAGDR
jgi:predicted signal transduction protein with EAL and GGDEF domain